jgi:hypothetical protein
VALWLVIDRCVNFGRVYCDFLVYIFLFLNFLRHQTMDKVQKYNSFNSLNMFVYDIQGCIQKFPDWQPGARTTNDTALCQ